MTQRFRVVGTPDRWAFARALMDEPGQRLPVAFFVRRTHDSYRRRFEVGVFVEVISHREFNLFEVHGTISGTSRAYLSVGAQVVFRIVIPSNDGDMLIVE